MLLDDLFNLRLLKVRKLVLFHVENNLGATPKTWALIVKLDGEASASAGLPDVLLIIIGLGNNLNLVGNQVSGVETNTKLT